MSYLYKRGKGATRRVMHLARYDQFGKIAGTFCNRTDFDTAINVPLARPVCKDCLTAWNRRAKEEG